MRRRNRPIRQCEPTPFPAAQRAPLPARAGRPARLFVPAFVAVAAALLLLGGVYPSAAAAEEFERDELDAAVSQLASPQAVERARASRRLLAAEESGEVLSRLSQVLGDAGATLRQQVEAVRILGRMEVPGAVPVLASVVGDESRDRLRVSAVMALAHYDNKEAHQAIVSLLPEAQEAPELLAATLFAVEKQQLVEALPALTELISRWEASPDVAVLTVHTARAVLPAAEAEAETDSTEALLAELERLLNGDAEVPPALEYAAGLALGERQHSAAVPTLIRAIVHGLEAPPQPPEEPRSDDEQGEEENGEVEEREDDADARDNGDATDEGEKFDEHERRNDLLAHRAARALGGYPIAAESEFDVYPTVLNGLVVNPASFEFGERELNAFVTFAVTAGADVLPRLVGTIEPEPADTGQERQTRVARRAIRELLDAQPEALLPLASEVQFLEEAKLVVLLEILENFAAREAVDFTAPILHPRGPEAHEFSPEVKVAALTVLERAVRRVHERQEELQNPALSGEERDAITAERDAAWIVVEPRDATVDKPTVVQLAIERLGDDGVVTDEEGRPVVSVRAHALDVLHAYPTMRTSDGTYVDRLKQTALAEGGALSDALQRRLVEEGDPALLARAAEVYIRATPDAEAAVQIVGLLQPGRLPDARSRQNLYTAIQSLSSDVGEVDRIVAAASHDLRTADELETRRIAAEVLTWSETAGAIRTLAQELAKSETPISLRQHLAQQLLTQEHRLSRDAGELLDALQSLYRDYRNADDDVERDMLLEPLRNMLRAIAYLPPQETLEGLRPFLSPRDDRLDVLALTELRNLVGDRAISAEVVPMLLEQLAGMEGDADLAALVQVLETSWRLPGRHLVERLQPHLGEASYMREGMRVLIEADIPRRQQRTVTRAMSEIAMRVDEQVARQAIRVIGEMTEYRLGTTSLDGIYEARPELRDEVTRAARRLNENWSPPEVD